MSKSPTKEFQDIIIKYVKDNTFYEKNKNLKNNEQSIFQLKIKNPQEMREDAAEYDEIRFHGKVIKNKYRSLKFEKNFGYNLKRSKSNNNIYNNRQININGIYDDFNEEIIHEIPDERKITSSSNNNKKISIDFSKYDKMAINLPKIKNNQLLIKYEDILPMIQDAKKNSGFTNSKQFIFSPITNEKNINEMKNYLISKVKRKIGNSQSNEKIIIRHNSRSKSREFTSRIKNLLENKDTKIVINKINKQSLQDKILNQINNLQNKLTQNNRENLRNINLNMSYSDELKRRYLYVIKNKFV